MMKASYLSAIAILLILLIGVGWYALSLQKEVEDLNAQNQDLQNAINELKKTVASLQKEVTNLKDENSQLMQKLTELDQERQQLANENEKLSKELDEIGVEINLLIDFGNGTKLWFNNTVLPYGATLLNATLAKAQPVKYSTYDFGVFVEEVMGVSNSNPLYWLWWKFENGKWVMGEVGADAVVLRDGGIYAWKYTDTSSWPPKPP